MDKDTARLLKIIGLQDELKTRLNRWFGLSTHEVDDIPERIDSMQLDEEDVERLCREMDDGNIINRIDDISAEYGYQSPE